MDGAETTAASEHFQTEKAEVNPSAFPAALSSHLAPSFVFSRLDIPDLFHIIHFPELRFYEVLPSYFPPLSDYNICDFSKSVLSALSCAYVLQKPQEAVHE